MTEIKRFARRGRTSYHASPSNCRIVFEKNGCQWPLCSFYLNNLRALVGRGSKRFLAAAQLSECRVPDMSFDKIMPRRLFDGNRLSVYVCLAVCSKHRPIDSGRSVSRIGRAPFHIFAQSKNKRTIEKTKKLYTLIEKWSMSGLLDSAEGQYGIFLRLLQSGQNVFCELPDLSRRSWSWRGRSCCPAPRRA
jgi:hypothetical protein